MTDTGTEPDVGEPDAQADAPTDAPPDANVSTVVELTVYDPTTDAPDANESVLFFQADGTFVEEVMTGTDGVARAEIDAGGSIVLMYRSDEDAMPYQATAFLGVSPGDRLVHRFPPLPATAAFAVTAPVDATAMTYRFAGTCAGVLSSGLPRPTPMSTLGLPSCADASVLVTSSDVTGVIGVTGAIGVDTTMPLTLAGPYARPAAFEVTVTGVHSDAEMVQLEAGHLMGDTYLPSGVGSSGAPSAGRYSATGMFADVPDGTVRVRAVETRAGYVPIEIVAVQPSSADVLADLTSLTVPYVVAPTYDVTSHAITWTEDGEGEIDGALAYLSFRRAGVTFGWTVYATPDDTTLELPELPAPWADYNPLVTDETGSEYQLLRGPGVSAIVTEPGQVLRELSRPSTAGGVAFARTFLP